MGKPEHTKHILANALRRLLHTKRYEEITVADIVQECGVSRYTFYYHFKDKQDLVNWIYLDARAQAIEVTSVDTLEGNLRRLRNLMEEDRELYSQVKRADKNGEFEQYFNELGYHCFLNLFKSYLGSRKIDPEVCDFIARYFNHAGAGMYWDMLNGKNHLSGEENYELSKVIWERGMYGALDYYAQKEEKTEKAE